MLGMATNLFVYGIDPAYKGTLRAGWPQANLRNIQHDIYVPFLAIFSQPFPPSLWLIF